MILSGEEIRQEAETRERTCPKGMKDSFYYGFREGAKWVNHIASEQKEYDEDSFHAIIEENVLKAIENQKAIDREDFKSLVKREFDSLYNLYIRKAGCDSEYSRTVAPSQMDAIDTLKNAILKAMEE